MRVRSVDGRGRLEVEHGKLSDLLEAGIADLEKSIADGIEVEMNTWFRTDDDTTFTSRGKICSVCLAGAVVRSGLGDGPLQVGASDPDKLAEEGFCSRDAANQLWALDAMRSGKFIEAVQYMPGRAAGVDPKSKEWNRLNELERMVRGAPWTHEDWTVEDRTAPQGGAGPVPGPMLNFFKKEVVPAMRARGF